MGLLTLNKDLHKLFIRLPRPIKKHQKFQNSYLQALEVGIELFA
jgi:hypothetical protein